MGPGDINVGDVEQLYDAVNNPDNAGKTIVLSNNGNYVLTGHSPTGQARPNSGRLELQRDMKLVGISESEPFVVIEVSHADLPDFTANARYGMIRAGRGDNTISRLDIRVPPEAGSGISTDLEDAHAIVTISWVKAGDPTYKYKTRGVDVRNTSTAVPGRKLSVVIQACSFYGGRQGIRIANFQGANECEISVQMTSNYVTNNQTGCLITNHQSCLGVIKVTSKKDVFTDNGVGCAVIGAIEYGLQNSIKFDATELSCVDNAYFVDPAAGLAGGLIVRGASTSKINFASNNTVEVTLQSCQIHGNQSPGDAIAHGAYCADPNMPAGVNNMAWIYVAGTADFKVQGIHSAPAETNRVVMSPQS